HRPVPVTAAALVALTILVSFPLVLWSRERAVQLAKENGELAEHNLNLAINNDLLAKKERDLKIEANKLAAANHNLAQKQTELAGEERKHRKQAQWELARATLERGRDLCERGDVYQGMPRLAHALSLAVKAEAGDLEGAARANLAA